MVRQYCADSPRDLGNRQSAAIGGVTDVLDTRRSFRLQSLPEKRRAAEPGVIPAGVIRPRSLTRREQEVYELMLEGMSDKEMAAQLKIALPTAKAHVRKVLLAFGVNTRARLLARLLASMVSRLARRGAS